MEKHQLGLYLQSSKVKKEIFNLQLIQKFQDLALEPHQIPHPPAMVFKKGYCTNHSTCLWQNRDSLRSIKSLRNNHRVYVQGYNLPIRNQQSPKYLTQVTLQEFADFYQTNREDFPTLTYIRLRKRLYSINTIENFNQHKRYLGDRFITQIDKQRI